MLSLEFPPGWLIELLFIYGTYIILLLLRKGYGNKQELKNQFIVAVLLLLLAFVGEFIGINAKLWAYFPGNWPITVWIGYFGIGLIAYQLVRFIDKLATSKKKV